MPWTLKDRLRDPASAGDRDLLCKLQVIRRADLCLAAGVFGNDTHSAKGQPKGPGHDRTTSLTNGSGSQEPLFVSTHYRCARSSLWYEILS